jgi:hypothetical protein
MNIKRRKNQGAALIIIVLFFVMISLVWVTGTSSSVMRDYISYRNLEISKRAYYLAEAGAEDAIYRIKKGWTATSPITIALDADSSVVTTIVAINTENKKISSVGTVAGFQRKMQAALTKSVPASFPYAVEVGLGGLEMEDTTSRVTGDIFSKGPIQGAGSTVIGATGAVFSTGSTGINGSIIDFQNTGTNPMFAGTISHATIGGNAFCSSISSSSTSTCKTLYALRADGILKPPPLTDAQVERWKTTAAANTLASCGTYLITGSVSLGPAKIPCKLKMTGGGTLTLTGPLWVTGEVEIKANATVNVATSFGSTTIPIIADPEDPDDRDEEGIIQIDNSTNWNVDVGQNPDAHVMLLSWNTDPDDETAINVTGSPTGNLMVYAAYGKIELAGTNVAVKQATGKEVALRSGAEVNYTNNLQNMLMYGDRFDPWWVYDWREVP